MTSHPKHADKVLINRQVDVPVTLKEKELGKLLVPLVVDAGTAVVDGCLSVTFEPRDRNRRDGCWSLMP